MQSEEQIFSFPAVKKKNRKENAQVETRGGLVRFKDLEIVIQDYVKTSKIFFPIVRKEMSVYEEYLENITGQPD